MIRHGFHITGNAVTAAAQIEQLVDGRQSPIVSPTQAQLVTVVNRIRTSIFRRRLLTGPTLICPTVTPCVTAAQGCLTFMTDRIAALIRCTVGGGNKIGFVLVSVTISTLAGTILIHGTNEY
jgi:hypothetical protein